MQRPRIDRAIHAQLDRLTRLLRCMDRIGGRATWGILWADGHHSATIRAAVRQRYLLQRGPNRWQLSAAGRRYLADLDEQLVSANDAEIRARVIAQQRA